MSSEPTGRDQPAGNTEGMPRWVRLSMIVAGILIAVMVIIMQVAGSSPGGHGPSRHVPPADTSNVESQIRHTTPVGRVGTPYRWS